MNNNRIYEHATNAGAYCETYLHGGDPKPPVLDNMDLIKFAKLIQSDYDQYIQFLLDRLKHADEMHEGAMRMVHKLMGGKALPPGW